MSSNLKSDSAAAAAAAARRAAIEAAKRAAEAAAKKAAADAAKKTAEASVKKLSARALKVSPRDELSTGRGSRLSARALRTVGAGLAGRVLETNAPKLTLSEALRAQRKGEPLATTLRTEVLGDGRANCLEQAVKAAKPEDKILLFGNQDGPVGHAVVQRPDGSVVDPSDASARYSSVREFVAAHPDLTRPVSVTDRQAEQVLATPPGQARDALIHKLGLDPVANRDVAGIFDNPVSDFIEDRVDDVVDAGEAVVDAGSDLVDAAREHGADLLEEVADITGGGLAAFGNTVDGFVDHVVPQEVQDALDALPAPIAGPAAILHAGETLEDLGNTVRDLPEFADAISEAASYRAKIRSLGPGDSVTLGANGNLAIEGIVGSASGSVKIQANDDGTFKMTVTGQLGVGVGGPLEEGLSGRASVTAGGSVEYTFASADEAVRGADIVMATAATAATGVLGAAADKVGLTERIFGADTGDIPELFDHASAVTLTEGGELTASLTGQAGITGNFAATATGGVRLELDDSGNVERVVLQSKLTEGASGTAGEGPNGVSAGVNGSVLIEQGFTVDDGTSVAELVAHPDRVHKEDDAKITFQAEVFGGTSAGAAGGGVSAKLTENEGVQATASFTGNPSEILHSGAFDAAIHGDFNGAVDALDEAGLSISLSVKHFSTDGVAAQADVGGGGSGGGFGVNVEQRDFDDEALFEFNGTLGEGRDRLADLVEDLRNQAVNGDAGRYLSTVLG